MGLFSQQTKDNYHTAMAGHTLKELKPKDGKIHVIVFRTFSKAAVNVFGCDEKYTNEMDSILVEMQNKGYEIVDVKINTLSNQGATGQRDGYITCVTYR